MQQFSTMLWLNAVEHNDISEIKSFLAQGIDVKRKNEDGWAALHVAAHHGHKAVVELLIKFGADVNQKIQSYWALHRTHWTPVEMAIEKGHIEIVKMLLSAGADMQSMQSASCGPLQLAVTHNYIEIVKLLLAHDVDVNVPNKDGSTAIHIAAENGFAEIVQLLLDAGAHVQTKNNSGKTALDYASKNNHQKIIALLIDHGADEEELKQDEWFKAISNNDILQVKKLLAQGISIDIQVKDGWNFTALHIASDYGYTELVALLLANNANPNRYSTVAAMIGGEVPLHRALRREHKEIVKLLLEHGADVNIKDAHGYTALHLAVYSGNIEIIQLLLACGADIHAKHVDETTPLHAAFINTHKEIIKLLVKNNANVNAKNIRGITPLHYAAMNGDIGIIQLLIDAGADFNSVDNEWKSVLHYTAEKSGNSRALSFLLALGLDVNIKAKDGSTPLHAVADDAEKNTVFGAHRCGDIDVETYEVLRAHGADIHAKTKAGQTPLHIAVTHNKIQLVQLLLNDGADVHAKDSDLMTPLHIALTFRRFVSLEDEEYLLELFEGHLPDTGELLENGYGITEILVLLLERGAEIHVQNKDHNSPCTIALDHGLGGIWKLLKKYEKKQA